MKPRNLSRMGLRPTQVDEVPIGQVEQASACNGCFSTRPVPRLKPRLQAKACSTGGRAAVLVSIAATLLSAHPMGNFSVSHYTRLDVSAKGVEVTYALDLAEVPTYTLLRDWKLDAKSPQAELEAKATEQSREWAKGLEFQAAGKPVQPKFVRSEIKLSDGAGGLSVARIVSTFELQSVKSPLTF